MGPDPKAVKAGRVTFFKATASLDELLGSSQYYFGYAQEVHLGSREIVCTNVQVPRMAFDEQGDRQQIRPVALMLGEVTFPRDRVALFEHLVLAPSWFQFHHES